MRLSQLREVRASVPVTVAEGQEPLIVSYAREGISLNDMRALDAAQEDEGFGPYDSNIGFLLGVRLGWELEDDDGSPIPVTEETLRERGVYLVGRMVEAVMTDIRPKAQETKSAS